MREIKFRLWNKKTKEFRYHPIAPTIDGEWSEYTGLKDKNGKEYYEEDLFKKDSSIFIVRWNNDRAGWWLYWEDGSASQPFSKILAESGENIGNTYEA